MFIHRFFIFFVPFSVVISCTAVPEPLRVTFPQSSVVISPAAQTTGNYIWNLFFGGASDVKNLAQNGVNTAQQLVTTGTQELGPIAHDVQTRGPWMAGMFAIPIVSGIAYGLYKLNSCISTWLASKTGSYKRSVYWGTFGVLTVLEAACLAIPALYFGRLAQRTSAGVHTIATQARTGGTELWGQAATLASTHQQNFAGIKATLPALNAGQCAQLVTYLKYRAQ